VGICGAGCGSAAQPVTAPKRHPAIQSSPGADLLVGTADEVPPHDQRFVEGRAAEQEQPGRA
jgi:hypothetical protein